MVANARRLTLDVFIQQGMAHNGVLRTNNAYVQALGFSRFYVRFTEHWIDKVKYFPCLDISNIEARKPGSGAWTRLMKRLPAEYPDLSFYVESVQSQQFAEHLLKTGFTCTNASHGALCATNYFMPSKYLRREVSK